MFVAAIATMGLGAFFASCADDSCVCTFVMGGISVDESAIPSEYGVATCGQLEDALNDANDITGETFDEIICK